MSAVAKSLIIATCGLVFAVFIGTQLGQGSWMLPGSIGLAGLLIGLYGLFFKAIRLEALILGFLVFGYIVGNRGFAQLTLTQSSPIYFGEAGMIACLALLGARAALKREPLIPRTPLSKAILVFLLLGAARLGADLFLNLSPAPSIVTIRDSATVYYALFFFIAYRVGLDPVGRRLMERCVLIGCIALLPVFLIQFFIAPDLFNRITFRGYPLIAHKGDLTTTYLAFSSFYFFLRPARGVRLFFLRGLSVIFFVGMLMLMARAALIGWGCAAFLLLLARRLQFLAIQACIALFALIILGALHLGEQSAVYTRLADKVESITDISGSHSYRGEVGDYSADNNQFRVVWWRNVFDETLRKGPIFGLGFGYDLAAGFLRNYYANTIANWDARSPHSIWVTVLGRMGFLGLLSFAIIVLWIVRNAVAAAREVARGRESTNTLAFWSGAIIILGSASFGVVLEGPMGGILFWSFLGLAASQTAKRAPKLSTVRTAEPVIKHFRKCLLPVLLVSVLL
jgi:hypothetical protein